MENPVLPIGEYRTVTKGENSANRLQSWKVAGGRPEADMTVFERGSGFYVGGFGISGVGIW